MPGSGPSRCIWAVWLALAAAQTEAAEPAQHFRLVEVDSGVWAAIHRPGGAAVCNAGIVDLGDGVLLVDSFLTPAAARALKKQVARLTGKPVRWVVNTHAHGDHVRGNQVFAESAVVVGTAAVRRAMIERAAQGFEKEREQSQKRLSELQARLEKVRGTDEERELLMWLGATRGRLESLRRLRLVPPELVFEKRMVLYGAKRRVEILEMGPAHSPSDVVVWLPEQGILFTGDLVFNRCHPYMGDGRPRRWKAALERLAGLQPRKVIPGHGPVGDGRAVTDMIGYIDAVEQLASRLARRGQGPDRARAADLPEPYSGWEFDRFLEGNVGLFLSRSK